MAYTPQCVYTRNLHLVPGEGILSFNAYSRSGTQPKTTIAILLYHIRFSLKENFA
nr:MAG TPA: hypothetical protein [Caudoviricetes sp.]